MAGNEHRYTVTVTWTGNLGSGTSGYKAYARDHRIEADGKALIEGSADPAFRGDPARWNPEDLLVGALSACHKLWYLHLCSASGIVVLAYEDAATGTMALDPDRGGFFTEVRLSPRVTIRRGDDTALAMSLHKDAHSRCFIANSVNFEVSLSPSIEQTAEASR